MSELNSSSEMGPMQRDVARHNFEAPVIIIIIMMITLLYSMMRSMMNIKLKDKIKIKDIRNKLKSTVSSQSN